MEAVRLYTVTEANLPDLSRLRAMASPIMPRPTNPMSSAIVCAFVESVVSLNWGKDNVQRADGNWTVRAANVPSEWCRAHEERKKHDVIK